MQETITAVSEPRTSQLIELAMRGLQSMYDSEKGFFCHRLHKTSSSVTREGISHRYTAMTLLGLLRAQSAGLSIPIDIEAMVDRLLGETSWVDNIGDLGLLLWLSAESCQKHLNRFYATFDISRALKRFPDARRRLTMELSWFLTGLVHASKQNHHADHKALANETYKLLRLNQGEHGLFGHMARWHSWAGAVRGHLGSFADQVYPIFALAHYSEVFNRKEARENALRCAHAICRLQGPLGQWWWHYDSVTGRVVQHYPVYSVHQHGMAPMALQALQEICAADFRAPINNGLGWLSGANELHQNLEDADAGVAWRCIQPPKLSSYAGGVRALMGKELPLVGLYTLYECRPYELGWLLYAFAEPSGTAMPVWTSGSEA
jgi:hypothetical protein